ncbi:MAG: hypothetical protein LUC27_02880, partial [Lachnospiraceae bacterium]|nr:hypothetical protein [Lachnospiraceae bacterium]
MFIKTAGFKRILKEAYKGRGLHIGATENTVYVSGSYWAIEVITKEIPKEKKAAIIELTGFIPDPGEQRLIDKDEIQMELAENPFYDVIENAGRANTRLDVTRLLIAG